MPLLKKSARNSVEGIRPLDKAFIIQTIKDHFPKCGIWIFGSRVCGKAKKYSDIDVALISKSDLDSAALSALREIFSESSLPIKVDLIDLSAVSEEFRKVVVESGVKWV